ncbi:hypothetical protein T472_0201300 [Youngiibacter fragilis 232.1]|uniref:Uncharacterized protein n=1 Tax=Youngiibacter fragilis 232.1 TaxID=994573 RepID=V7I9B5_9CLOT|nr:hypothetical protein T472_0201300 [Youngiibacter fragilis 232.1]
MAWCFFIAEIKLGCLKKYFTKVNELLTKTIDTVYRQ